jgi:hypothetical protein
MKTGEAFLLKDIDLVGCHLTGFPLRALRPDLTLVSRQQGMFGLLPGYVGCGGCLQMHSVN